MNKGLLLDLDGCVRTTRSGKVTPDHPDDQVVLPGRKEKIQAFKDRGYRVVAVTNQGGIGLGHTTHEKVQKTLHALNEDLGRPFDDMLYEGSAPRENHPRRKPNPGMIHEAAEKHNLDLSKSVMVGDKETDRQAAEKAGVPFVWAKDFFSRRHEAQDADAS